MFTLAPGKCREIWQPARCPSHRMRTVSWFILDANGKTIAETTTKRGAMALLALLNAR